jgi:hypothetical protein
MGQITKVTPDMIQVANNVTSTTIGNTTSGVSLTFDSNGVITSAANVVLSVANTQLTGTITNAQLGTNAVSNTKIAAGAVEQYFADTGYNAQFRNRIINGDMRIAQRGTAAVTANDSFPVDRYKMSNVTDGSFSAQQDSSAPAGFINSLKWTVTTEDASIGADQYAVVRQIIEGNNCADLGWGASGAKTVTLSFWVRSSVTGTFGGALRNADANRTYPFTYSISAADTWEQKSVTVAGDTTGTWGTGTGAGITVFWSLAAGSNFAGTAGSWSANQYLGATGQTQLMSTLNATWFITGVQLEVGSVATPFERRPFGAELMLCQRYYWQENYSGGGAQVGLLQAYGSSNAFGLVLRVPQTMRSSVTVTTGGTATFRMSNSASSDAVVSGGSFVASGNGVSCDLTRTGGGLTAGNAVALNTQSATYIGCSSEL